MVRHFKSKKAYRKFTAFVKMHGIKTTHPKDVVIAGKEHRIKNNGKRKHWLDEVW